MVVTTDVSKVDLTESLLDRLMAVVKVDQMVAAKECLRVAQTADDWGECLDSNMVER